MRTYESLVKRINIVKKQINALPERLDYKSLAYAYRAEVYIRKSYETILTKGISVKLTEVKQ